MKIQNKLLSLLLLAALTAGALAGCEKKDDATQVQERAVARWNALIAGDPKSAYDFLSPGYRSTVSREQYEADIKRKGFKWTSVKFLSTKCDQAICTARLMLGYDITLPTVDNRLVKTQGPITEKWVKGDGGFGRTQWFFLPNIKTLKPEQGADVSASPSDGSGSQPLAAPESAKNSQ